VSAPALFLDGKVAVHAGDCLDAMSELRSDSVDSCVCDPPYHLHSIVKRFGAGGSAPAKFGTDGAFARASSGFMSKVWDGGDIAFRPETWAHVFRVLKPGAYLVAFSSSRTFGRMQVAIEDAGFVTHPLIGWIFGQGFPKAHRVKAEGWEGWRYGGQALKPALEPIYMGQKPFSESTGTANVVKHGVGALNIDGCRVPIDPASDSSQLRTMRRGQRAEDTSGQTWGLSKHSGDAPQVVRPEGRWPANVVLDGSDEVIAAFPDNLTSGTGAVKKATAAGTQANAYGKESRAVGTPNVEYGDSGSAARFFYSSKADADDRLGSKHPTVKPVDLMQYLVRLVTPKGGLVLDPFAGTGTTGEAAFREGCRAVLIEREPEYLADIERRCALILAGPAERRRESVKARGKDDGAGPLFAREAAE
jgi:site-specific DNA-methyltransferase (adenine-specific)